MRYFKERFGFEEIRLSKKENNILQNELIRIDFKRIEVIAILSVIVCFIMMVIDVFFFNDEYLTYYLILDFTYLCISAFLIFYSFYKNEISVKFKRAMIYIYPALMLMWAIGFVTFTSGLLLNLITYYIAIFTIAFAIVIPFRVLLVYYVLIPAEYIGLSLWFDLPIDNETIIIILVGELFTLPLYLMFKSFRINVQAAIIRLNRSNKDLTGEVNNQLLELRNLNEDLQNEIVKRRITEQKLRIALEKAETSDKLKSEFLANISHEIRTPLNAIIGFTEMLSEDGIEQNQKKQFQKLVSSNTMYLLSTIDDIFDASLVSTQQIKPIINAFNVNQFLDSITYETTGLAIKHNKPKLTFKTTKVDNDNLAILTDEFLFKKAMLRIIDNSYKFTEKGSIEVGAKLIGSKVEFFVIDTGVGIEEKDFEKIFEPFVQGDGSFTRGFGGSGLGLTIVGGIVKSLKCQFDFDSKKEQGSTFSLSFKNFLVN